MLFLVFIVQFLKAFIQVDIIVACQIVVIAVITTFIVIGLSFPFYKWYRKHILLKFGNIVE